MGPRRGRVKKPPGKGWEASRDARRHGGLLLLALFVLVPAPAFAAEMVWPESDLVLSAIVIAASALALSGALWALAEYRGTLNLKRALRQTKARARALLASRDAWLSAGRESLIVWGADMGEPVSFGNAAALMETCLTGPDATAISVALDELAEHGTAFTLTARDKDGRGIQLRGRPAGGYAAVYLEEETAAAKSDTDFRTVLDALGVPVWVRGKDLALRFVNRAYLGLAGGTLESALDSNIALDRSERDLAATALSGNESVSAKRFAVLGGHRRALNFNLSPLPDGGVAGSAEDVTAITEAESRLQQHIDAHADTLDKLATAVAIFGPDRKLSFFNRAYVRLWGLAETWLDAHPTEGEILDRLRELRRLPEQPDFRAWKQERLKFFDRPDHHPEELWHIPGGKTLRVVAQPHPFGGMIFLYEDVSDQLKLESSYNTLIKVQKATLDTLQEGVAVFGPDGRLKLSNAAFARIWRLEPADLTGEPHLKAIADACGVRFGRNRAWDIVTSTVTAAAPERGREWGEVERSDGSVISLSIAPLPDGATLASFVDVTDRFRIESALREKNDALEAGDKLKSEFVKRVSYEFRTPLNSILGFAEMLQAGTAGPLGERQKEYVDAVVKASNTLRYLINDILDLSQIEAGAMELDLEKIDLYAMLSGIAEMASEWAGKAGLRMELDCREDAGTFVGDGRRLRQVVFNLLSNALKYTPRGGAITLSGAIADADVQISVSDTGMGVPEDVMPSAFERFTSKGGGGKRAGVGLGLALVNRFIELHHGWVELESGEHGTRVTCHIPKSLDRGKPTRGEREAKA